VFRFRVWSRRSLLFSASVVRSVRDRRIAGASAHPSFVWASFAGVPAAGRSIEHGTVVVRLAAVAFGARLEDVEIRFGRAATPDEAARKTEARWKKAGWNSNRAVQEALAKRVFAHQVLGSARRVVARWGVAQHSRFFRATRRSIRARRADRGNVEYDSTPSGHESKARQHDRFEESAVAREGSANAGCSDSRF
jgi:hypothetical protein